MELFKLLGKIVLDSSEALQEMDKTNSKASGIGQTFVHGIATVAKWGAAIGTAAVAAGTAIVGVATKAASAGDNIDKMSQKIGISREAYQELDFICSQSGTSVDTLQMGIKTLTNQMQSAADGTASAAEMFDKLGVSIYDSNGQLKDQETMMWEAMSALQGMENQTEKAALATDLFGRSGSELMPLLNGASGSIEEMKQKAHELGLVMSDEFVDDSVAFTDTMDQFKRSLTSAGTKIAAVFMPYLQKMVDGFVNAMPKVQEFASGIAGVLDGFISTMTNGEERTAFFKSALESIFSADFLAKMGEASGRIKDLVSQFKSSAVETFSAKLEPLKEMFASVKAAIQPLVETYLVNMTTAFENFMTTLNTVVLPVVSSLVDGFISLVTTIADSVQPAIEKISEVWETMTGTLSTVWNDTILPVIQGFIDMFGQIETESGIISKVGELFGAVFDAIASIFEWFNTYIVQGVFVPAIQLIAQWVTDNMGTIQEIFQSAFDIIGGIIDFFVALFQGDWEGMWEAVKSVLSSAFEAVKSIFQLLKDTIVSIATAIWSKIVNIWESTKTAVLQTVIAIYNNIKAKFDAMKAKVVEIVTSIWSKVTSKFEEIKTSLTSKVNTIKENITSKFEEAKTTIETTFENIKKAISDKIEDAKTAVSDAIEAIKGFFNFEWSLPELKLPHIKISGEWDLKEGKFPSFGVEWYKSGAVLTEPTIFGMNGNNAMVGGEAGPEAVAPIDVLQDYVAEAVANQNAQLVEVLQAILNAIVKMDAGLANKLLNAIENGMAFEVNGREFGRMVRKYA